MLNTMVEQDASDLYLTAGSLPIYRIEGICQPGGDQVCTPGWLEKLARHLLGERQWKQFDEHLEMNLALPETIQESARFRVNLFRQRGSVGLVVRKINLVVPTIKELGLPSVLETISLTKRGLVLIVGATDQGKSTTLAAMIDHRNRNLPGHIITIEDPIEYVHRHRKSIVNQREVGFDTHSFEDGLKNALRQAPDVVLIGEIRDRQAMEVAVALAETGHLCLSTLHSTNANQALERIVSLFPDGRHNEIYLQLSLNLRAIISQRLVTGVDGRRMAAMEILLDTPRIKDLIKRGEIYTIKEALEKGELDGCQAFDTGLFNLYREGRIDLDQALLHADSPNNLRLKIKVSEARESGNGEIASVAGLRLEEDPPKDEPGGL
jgi:twitching motility protein PilU